jgi:hypothetical protein
MGFRFRRTLGETRWSTTIGENCLSARPIDFFSASGPDDATDDPQVLWWQCVMFQSNLCEYSGTFTPWREQGLLVKPKSSFFDTRLFS